jgi:Flp pilus assembly pilin Flp
MQQVNLSDAAIHLYGATLSSCGNYVNPNPLLHLQGINRSLYTGQEMKSAMSRFFNDEQGQDLIEYTLLLAFVALASATLFTKAGGSVKTIWSAASTSLANAAVAAS